MARNLTKYIITLFEEMNFYKINVLSDSNITI